jgi:acetyltransferase
VELPQVLDFLANDGSTQSILVYMEGIRHARRFMSALRAAAYAKPVVVLKAGRKAAGSRVALTHSAAIVGSDDVFDAALRRAGVVRVRQFTQLISAARCLASRFKPVGRNLAIVTNGGGPAVMAADWADTLGLVVDQVHDLGEDAEPASYVAAMQSATADRNVDGVLLIFSPKAGSDADAVATAVGEAFSPTPSRCWAAGWAKPACVPRATCSATSTCRCSARPRRRWTPSTASPASTATSSCCSRRRRRCPVGRPDVEGARLLIEGVLAERRKVLTEMESKALLAAFHIPVTRTMLARSANEAMLIASQLGYPVALKIDSPDISAQERRAGRDAGRAQRHPGARPLPGDAGRGPRAQPGARINGITVQPMAGLRRGREVCVGLTTDEAFGPVITFGAGGTMIELIADRAMELPPLNQFLARRLIERSRADEMLGEWRGAPAADEDALEQLLLRVSDMVCMLPQLRRWTSTRSSWTTIWRRGGGRAHRGRRRGAVPGTFGHLAVLPYPTGLEREWPLKGGGLYTIRPIHPGRRRDAADLCAQPVAREPLLPLCQCAARTAGAHAGALHADRLRPRDGAGGRAQGAPHRRADGTVTETESILAVSRYVTNPDGAAASSRSSCPTTQGPGAGLALMLSIMDVARSKGLAEIVGLILANNSPMFKLMNSLGFHVAHFPEDPDFKIATKAL